MKRFIRYLYEYDQGKRIRNVGFVKIEAGNEETIVNMQGKGFHNSNERKLVLYLFYEKNGEIVGIRHGEMKLTTPVLSWHFRYAVDSTEISGIYDKINGVMIETENGRRIAATWDDRAVDVGRMKEFAPDLLHNASVFENKSTGREEETGRKEEEMGRSAPEVEELRPAEKETGRKEEEMRRSAPKKANHTPQDKQDKQGKKLTKIQRKDISRLPRCEWKLANNPFLIHGYDNYHHLVLIEDGNSLKIGVPGIYHIKEAQCADMFGFGEFILAEELKRLFEEDETQHNEPQEDEMFGYWCRKVNSRQNMRRPGNIR